MVIPRLVDNQRGVALITVVLVALAVSSVAIAASMMTMSGTLVRKYSERTSMASHAALSGVERGLSVLLGDDTLLPATGYTILEDSAEVYDAMGIAIPGVRRSIYIGPSSDPSRGSIVSEVWIRGGVRAVRRLEVSATSFASFAQHIDHDHGVEFTATDDQFGPIHSNFDISIGLPAGADSATFMAQVTVGGSITNPGRGVFMNGFTEGVSRDSLPLSSDLAPLRTLAITGGLLFPGTTGGAFAATTRVEFIAVDMDGLAGTTDDIEGFVRVYRNAADVRNLMAGQLLGNPIDTPNCGTWDGTTFKSFPNGGLATLDAAKAAVDSNQYGCYLGGDPILNNGIFSATPPDGGTWLPWTGPPVPPGNLGFDSRLDKNYLHPYTPGVNTNTTGVIYVDGDVAVSGVVRGRVTLVSLDDIIIVDDLVQHTDPGANACEQDLLGLIATDDVAIADNTLNTPQRYGGGGLGDSYHTMSATKDEYAHAIIMALDEFLVSNANFGPDAADNPLPQEGPEPCEDARWGRGCLYITGGLLRRHRRPDDFGSASGTGYQLRLSYNGCVRQGAPPHFPATGDFKRQRVVEMDAANFDPATWFAAYQS